MGASRGRLRMTTDVTLDSSSARGDFAHRELNSARDPQVAVRYRAALVALGSFLPTASAERRRHRLLKG